ncbi:MAG: trehalose-6-phosphate synthase [Phycisphaeraceae bacterium]|nr:trehalose-6-phosphate synthase [Phycisphaeraceae bacterium]
MTIRALDVRPRVFDPRFQTGAASGSAALPHAGRLIVAANRLPVRRIGSGKAARWQASDGGLVTALRPVLRGGSRATLWVGWPGSKGRGSQPGMIEAIEAGGIRMQPVSLSHREVDAFYHCFSNRTIWPLYHDAIHAPEFDESWWDAYVRVNARFARSIAENANHGDSVWIHDYHLQLVPAMLRELKPGLRIGIFLHIPFPPRELFGWLPWRARIAEGLLGADVIGFQTESDAANFMTAALTFTNARTGSDGALSVYDRRVRIDSFPISIDFDEFSSGASDSAVKRAAESIRRKVGPERRILLGVDRLDYTKGIDLRLRAFAHALHAGSLSVENCVLIQVAVPSREPVPEYARMRDSIERLVGRINGEHAVPGRVAVHYFRRSLPRKELLAYYLAADAMIVTPVRDGMNLVAKEYVACRNDESGVLVLSETAGAAQELREAILVNPRDISGTSDAIVRAAKMPATEAAARMIALREHIRSHDVHRWADGFLGALCE